jgi:hypothetical protein
MYPDNNGLYRDLRTDVLKYLSAINDEYKCNPNRYKDVLPVTFESKVKFMMTIMKVKYTKFNLFGSILEKNFFLWQNRVPAYK